MKYRTPDIKTADALFEVLSNPEKTLDTLKQMKAIRDDIQEGLKLKEMETNAKRTSEQATKMISESNKREREVTENCERQTAHLQDKIDAHEAQVKKDRQEIADGRKKLNADISAFSGEKNAAIADIDARLSTVEMRETDAQILEERLARQQTELNTWARQIDEVVSRP